MNPEDILEEAAEIIEQRGWIQGHLISSEGVCAFGATHVAIQNHRDELGYNMTHWLSVQANQALQRYVFERCDKTSVPAWNDAPERTKQEVLDALHGAAKDVRRKEGR